MAETKIYYRVEQYNGCALEPPPRPFESRAKADDYVRTHPAADTRIVKVNADGAAIVNDCWEKKIGEFIFKYSTEGVVGVGYVHSLHIIQRDGNMAGRSFQTTPRLSQDDVERRFSLEPWVSESISSLT